MPKNIDNKALTKMDKTTFTGIDEKTDVTLLIELFHDYPNIEFGYLIHEDFRSFGNRCGSPSFLDRYKDSGLPLSLHVCGNMAKRVFRSGEWDEIDDFIKGNLSLFSRVQLNNVRKVSMLDNGWKLSVPMGISEVIIQQHSVDKMPIYQYYLDNQESINGSFTVLFDASGGRGLYADAIQAVKLPYAGYAGGIGPYNVLNTVLTLEKDEAVTRYWIDMQTHVRDEHDWFSVESCRKVCETLRDYTMR